MSEKEYYVHPSALVVTTTIGKGTRIWAFCNIQQDAAIGEDCNIGDHCFVERNVVMGDRVTVKNGVSLWDGLTIEDDVFIGPNAVFTNDVRPRSKVYHDEVDRTLIKQGATIGANATIVAGHTIGRYAFIGAASVVTKDVPDYSLWYGNPARMIGYVCQCARRLDLRPGGEADTESHAACECGRKYRFENSHLVPVE